MRLIRPFFLILGFVIVAAAVFVAVRIVFPHSADSHAAGWVVYSVGGALIILAYFRRKRREKGVSHTAEQAQNSLTALDSSDQDQDRNLNQVRERIRLRKARGDYSDK